MPTAQFGERPTPESGTICMWSGLLSNIPSGWVICDGMNGTPNMLDKFAKQVPDGSTNPGATGGTHSFTLASSQLPSHDHDGKAFSAGSHNHTYYNVSLAEFIRPYNGLDHDAKDYVTTESNGSHSHNVSTGPDTTGGDGSIENRPNYYEVAFIMKV